MDIVDGFSTHLGLLSRHALQAPVGSTIVELGCGLYSSVILSEIAKARKLKYIIYYQGKEWQKIVEPFVEAEFRYVENWEEWTHEEPCHLAFLDNNEVVVKRFQRLPKLMRKASVVVVHDANTYGERGINIEEAYNIIEKEERLIPHTYVLEGIKQAYAENSKRSAIVCVYRAGGDYDSQYNRYISELYNSVKKNLKHLDYDFFCLTDQHESIRVGGVTAIPLQSSLQGWHAKFEIFREELWLQYRNVLYLDLDTVVTAPIDGLLADNSDFMALRDLWHPESLATGVMLFNPRGKRFLFEKAVELNPHRAVWDQRLIEEWIGEAGIEPSFFQDHYSIASYKTDIKKHGKPIEDYQIVCFHGRPRPHEISWQLPKSKASGHEVNFGSVDRWCEGETVYIIGGGTSLQDVDLKTLLDGKTCLAVNGSYELDLSETLFFGDTVWWTKKRADVMAHNHLKRIYTTSPACHEKVVNIRPGVCGISNDPKEVAWNLNSGMAAINVALLGGAKKIVLLGFDMCKDENGNSNWYENIRFVADNTYQAFLSREPIMAQEIKQKFPDVEIVNANPDSHLSAFKKQPLNEVLETA